MKSRFENHVKKNILEIEKDQYILPDDPYYITKLMRYNNKSAHFHFSLGQQHEKQGRYSRALFHYIEAVRVHSPYYYKAKTALFELEKKLSERAGLAIIESGQNMVAPDRSLYKMIIFALTVSNFVFIVLLIIMLWWI